MNRWAFTFGALALSIAAFRRASRRPPAKEAPPQTDSNLLQMVPVVLLAYVWLFLPNPIFTLFEGIDVNTVFFMGVSNYAAALMMTARGEQSKAHHALFCLGFLGLLLSKESNIALALWLLVCYLGWVIVKGLSEKKMLVRVRIDSGHSRCLVENNHSLGNGRGQRHALRPQLANF